MLGAADSNLGMWRESSNIASRAFHRRVFYGPKKQSELPHTYLPQPFFYTYLRTPYTLKALASGEASRRIYC